MPAPLCLAMCEIEEQQWRQIERILGKLNHRQERHLHNSRSSPDWRSIH